MAMHEPLTPPASELLPKLARQQADRRQAGGRGRLLLVLATFAQPPDNPDTGDGMVEVLHAAIMDRLRNSVRGEDLVLRRDRRDFLMALVDCLPEQAALRLSIVLQAVGERPIEVEGNSIPVVLIAGAATVEDDLADDVAAQRVAIDLALSRATSALAAARVRGSLDSLLLFDGVETVVDHPLVVGRRPPALPVSSN